MPIPEPYLDALAGRFVMVTSAPYVGGAEGRRFLSTLRIGDPALIATERDEHGNVVVVDSRQRSALGVVACTVSTECLTVTAKPRRSVPLAEIPRECAAHVLHAFGGMGYPAGGFTRALIEALTLADMTNRYLLSLGHPEYAAAVTLAKDVHGGMEILQAINRGEDRSLEILSALAGTGGPL